VQSSSARFLYFLRVWHMATALYSCSALGSEGLRLLPPKAAASPLKEFYEYTPWACTHKQELKRRCRGMSACPEALLQLWTGHTMCIMS